MYERNNRRKETWKFDENNDLVYAGEYGERKVFETGKPINLMISKKQEEIDLLKTEKETIEQQQQKLESDLNQKLNSIQEKIIEIKDEKIKAIENYQQEINLLKKQIQLAQKWVVEDLLDNDETFNKEPFENVLHIARLNRKYKEKFKPEESKEEVEEDIKEEVEEEPDKEIEEEHIEEESVHEDETQQESNLDDEYPPQEILYQPPEPENTPPPSNLCYCGKPKSLKSIDCETCRANIHRIRVSNKILSNEAREIHKKNLKSDLGGIEH